MTAAAYYPVFLDLGGRRCVVLGDTRLADEKVEVLRASGADVIHHRRAFVPGDLEGAHLAIDASGDARGQEAARLEADTHRVLLNVVDVAPKCDWIAPAVVRRGPLQVAVSTGGESPFLASTLRGRLEKLLGDELGTLTSITGRVRRNLRLRGVPMDRQLRAYRRLLRSDIRSLVAGGDTAGAEAIAAVIETQALHGSEDDGGGEVVLVGAGPGDPGLLTDAGREALMDADVVVHDALVSAAVLRLCRRDATVIDVGKRGGRASASQEAINDQLIEHARAGRFVVRLKGGDPYLFGRGGEEVNALRAAGVAVRVVPGVSAALAAAAVADIPLTHRGVAASVAIVTGQRAAGIDASFDRLAREADTLVVLMPGDLAAIAARLSAVRGGAHPAALIASATTPAQRVVRAPLGRIAAAAHLAGLAAPATLVCGHVVDVLASDDSLQAAVAAATGG